MDCVGITSVLSEAVAGFGGHEIRHDHVWVKQGRAGQRTPSTARAAGEAKVQKLFPERGLRD